MVRAKLDAEIDEVDDEVARHDIAWGDEADADGDSPQSGATISINGKELGNLDDLIKQPTEEFTEAMRGLVERAMPAADLTTTERAELLRYEAVIKRGLETFVSVGNALLAIRRDRLYRATHSTFEVYCEQRWQMTRSYANRLIGAAEVVGNLAPIGTILPATESQARPLTKLEPQQQVEAWSSAVDDAQGKVPTAAQVTKAATELVPAKPPIATPGKVMYFEPTPPPPIETDPIAITEPVISMPTQRLAVHFASETPEHYTPREVLDAVVACLGEIDLDPCSNSKESPNVPAALHYTREDDGLAQTWEGKVYLNPPYGREIGRWIDKLCAEYEAGHVTEAIALVPARTDTDWFDQLIDGFKFHCFVHGRLQFIGNDGNAPFPSAIVYLGTEWGRFYHAFRSFGRIVQETNAEMFGD